VMCHKPQTLGEAVNYVQQAEDIMRRTGQRDKKPNKNGQQQQDKKKNWQNQQNVPVTPYYGGYYPMSNGAGPTAIDLVNVNLQQDKKVKNKQNCSDQIAKELCFKCNQKGHIARFCPLKGQGQQPSYPMALMMPMYPAYPVMPQYNHKVSRSNLNLNNVETMTDSQQGNQSSQ